MPVEKGDTEYPPAELQAAPPPYSQSQYGQVQQPQYGQPQYGQPQYGQPQYGQPQYGQAQYGQTNVVVAPGGVTMSTQARPPDYMSRAIFATLCCFWPTGIFAIIKASEANSAANRGEMDAAHTAYRSARQFTIISVVAGILSFVVAAIIVGVYVGVVLNAVYTYN